jgi:Tol biopolymer transport system component
LTHSSNRTSNILKGVLIGPVVALLLWPQIGAAADRAKSPAPGKAAAPAPASAERHFKNIKQLTFGRQNAEAYFSFSGNKLIFQSTNNWMKDTYAATLKPDDIPLGCYQMYVMDLDSESVRLVSTGSGATTCGYFFPGDRRILYSSTHLHGPNCPPKPKREGAYRWALDDYDLFAARIDGQEMQRLTNTPGYDAEATVSPDGKTIIWTSVRDGDLDIYAMDLDGSHHRRLTDDVGYDGGAFFSPDSKRIVYRASHPTDPAEIAHYKELLGQRLVEPGQLELFIMNADGSGKRQVTSNGASNFSPFFHPDGKRIVFSSNIETRGEGGRPSFHLYLVGDDGTGLERLTFEGEFNSFPMFSPDGKRVVWVSDRNAKQPGEFNVFLAEWVP